MRLLQSIRHLKKVAGLLDRKEFEPAFELMVRWRTEEIEKQVDVRFSEEDVARLVRAVSYHFEIIRRRYKFDGPKILKFYDDKLQAWTALWGMKIATPKGPEFEASIDAIHAKLVQAEFPISCIDP